MRQISASDKWKHRRMYDKFLLKGRRAVLKAFDTYEETESCRISLGRIRQRRNEKFFITQKNFTITISDKKETLYDESC